MHISASASMLDCINIMNNRLITATSLEGDEHKKWNRIYMLYMYMH